MRKVFIVGSLVGTQINRFNNEVISFFRETESVTIEFIPTFPELLEVLQKHKDCFVLYCPTRIPKKIQSRLLKNDGGVFELLDDHNITLGHIKIKNGVIQCIVLSFNGKGHINKIFFPRKKKEAFYKHLHLQRGIS